jgi:hypothetical protein
MTASLYQSGSVALAIFFTQGLQAVWMRVADYRL